MKRMFLCVLMCCLLKMPNYTEFHQTHPSAPRLGAREGPNSVEEHREGVERAESPAGIPGLHQHALQTLHQEVRTAETQPAFQQKHQAKSTFVRIHQRAQRSSVKRKCAPHQKKHPDESSVMK